MGEAESDSAGDYDREQGPDWGDLLCPGLVGVPLLVSYDRKWVCSRLRYQVLLNVLRLFRRDSPLLRRAGGCEIAELMQLSGVLELRLVDAHGESLVRPSTDAGAETAEAGDSAGGKNPFVQRIRELWASAAPTDVDQGDWMRAVAQLAARDGGSEDAQGLVERLFGTPLSGDKQLKIGTRHSSPQSVRLSRVVPHLLTCAAKQRISAWAGRCGMARPVPPSSWPWT